MDIKTLTDQELLIIGAFCNNDNRKRDVEFNKHEIKRLGQKLLIEVSSKLQQSEVIKSVCDCRKKRVKIYNLQKFIKMNYGTEKVSRKVN